MRIFNIGVFVIGLGAIACDGPSNDCAPLMGKTEIQYVGHAFGRGEVEITAAGGDRVEGRVVLRGEQEGDAVLSLGATGTCRDGVARLRLGGADHPQAKARVLGGRLVLVHDAELLGHDFGMWRARMKPKDGADEHEIHGYLRERTDPEPIATR